MITFFLICTFIFGTISFLLIGEIAAIYGGWKNRFEYPFWVRRKKYKLAFCMSALLTVICTTNYISLQWPDNISGSVAVCISIVSLTLFYVGTYVRCLPIHKEKTVTH